MLDVQKSVKVALREFWREVAHRYPEIDTGDLPPEVVHELEAQAQAAVELWIGLNQQPRRGFIIQADLAVPADTEPSDLAEMFDRAFERYGPRDLDDNEGCRVIEVK